MKAAATAGYLGTVIHQRLRPRRHRLEYQIYFWLFDLDELVMAPRRFRLFSHNRFNLFSFYDRDHGDGGAAPLKQYVQRQLAAAGIDIGDGPVRLLCSPRVLGYAFNPLSVYFCYRPDLSPAAILYEVNNTFGQRHSYLIPADGRVGEIRQSCPKQFYVSPFIEMAMTYHFRVMPPGRKVSIKIQEDDGDGALLFASFEGEHRALSDRLLLRLFFVYPLVTLKVIAGIHWEALRLWLKGVRIVKRPPPPREPLTIVAEHVR